VGVIYEPSTDGKTLQNLLSFFFTFPSFLWRHLPQSFTGNSNGPSVKEAQETMELVLKNRGKLIDKKEVSGNLNLSVEQTLSLTQDVLLTEIEELKRKVLAK